MGFLEPTGVSDRFFKFSINYDIDSLKRFFIGEEFLVFNDRHFLKIEGKFANKAKTHIVKEREGN